MRCALFTATLWSSKCQPPHYLLPPLLLLELLQPLVLLLPLLSVYTGSKAAVNAFTESLALELAHFNIRAHVVLPGRAPTTSFGANAKQRIQLSEAYAALTESVFAGWAQSTEEVTTAEDVAQAVWLAATSDNAPLRIAAGADAVALM